MRAALLGLVALFVLGGAVLLFWFGDSSTGVVLVAPDSPKLSVGNDGVGTLESRRVPVESAPSSGGVEFRFVDAMTGDAIEGGRILDVHAKLLGTTDRAGAARVSTPHLNTLVFGADGYLTEHFFDRADELQAMIRHHARSGHVRIVLEPDDLTQPCQLRFVDGAGRALSEVTFRVGSLAVPAPSSASIPTVQIGPGSVSPELRAAWRRHVLLSTMRRPDFNPELLHFGAQSQSESYVCQGVADMRFVAAGPYRVEAQAGELVGRQDIEVIASSDTPIVIRLDRGAFVTGSVVGTVDSKPVVGALIVASRDGQIVTSVETDKIGRFRLGPMALAVVLLEIQHQDYAPFKRAGVLPGTTGETFTLQPLPENRVQGVVRCRPDGPPISGAEVRLTSGLGVVTKGLSDAQGQFDLKSTLIEPTLEVLAKGYLEYAEMINANGKTVNIELVPDQPRARQQAGLSALISGRVLDAKQRPVPNCPVHVRSNTPQDTTAIPGRRIIRGGVIPAGSMVVTKADGTFLIEWSRSETLQLFAGKIRPDDQGYSLAITRGKLHQADLREH